MSELISFIVMIALIVFLFIGNSKCEKSEWIYSKTPYSVEKIVSLNDSNQINGKFYMKCGYIEEDLYYQYMVKLNNGGFVANKVKSENATLYYDDNNYRVEWYTRTKKWFYFKREETQIKIYIPEGSISEDYLIDLN